jgi:hypothetical protein
MYAANGVTCSFSRFLSSGQSRPGSGLRAANVGLDDQLAAELPQMFYSC